MIYESLKQKTLERHSGLSFYRNSIGNSNNFIAKLIVGIFTNSLGYVRVGGGFRYGLWVINRLCRIVQFFKWAIQLIVRVVQKAIVGAVNLPQSYNIDTDRDNWGFAWFYRVGHSRWVVWLSRIYFFVEVSGKEPVNQNKGYIFTVNRFILTGIGGRLQILSFSRLPYRYLLSLSLFFLRKPQMRKLDDHFPQKHSGDSLSDSLCFVNMQWSEIYVEYRHVNSKHY